MGTTEHDYLDVLRSEFAAEDGTFLIQLRPYLTWDKEAFSRLAVAMEACCKESQEKELLERWLAAGFWFMSWYVKDWTTHPNFPRPYPQEYYKEAYQRLELLAYWYFRGESPNENGRGFEPL